MKSIIETTDFTSFELDVIKDPVLLNEYLKLLSETEDREKTTLYAFAKERYKGVIPLQVIRDIVKPEFRDTTKVHPITKQKKISILKRAIAKGRQSVANNEDKLRELMGEPFYIVSGNKGSKN